MAEKRNKIKYKTITKNLNPSDYHKLITEGKNEIILTTQSIKKGDRIRINEQPLPKNRNLPLDHYGGIAPRLGSLWGIIVEVKQLYSEKRPRYLVKYIVMEQIESDGRA